MTFNAFNTTRPEFTLFAQLGVTLFDIPAAEVPAVLKNTYLRHMPAWLSNPVTLERLAIFAGVHAKDAAAVELFRDRMTMPCQRNADGQNTALKYELWNPEKGGLRNFLKFEYQHAFSSRRQTVDSVSLDAKMRDSSEYSAGWEPVAGHSATVLVGGRTGQRETVLKWAAWLGVSNYRTKPLYRLQLASTGHGRWEQIVREAEMHLVAVLVGALPASLRCEVAAAESPAAAVLRSRGLAREVEAWKAAVARRAFKGNLVKWLAAPKADQAKAAQMAASLDEALADKFEIESPERADVAYLRARFCPTWPAPKTGEEAAAQARKLFLKAGNDSVLDASHAFLSVNEEQKFRDYLRATADEIDFRNTNVVVAMRDAIADAAEIDFRTASFTVPVMVPVAVPETVNFASHTTVPTDEATPIDLDAIFAAAPKDGQMEFMAFFAAVAA